MRPSIALSHLQRRTHISFLRFSSSTTKNLVVGCGSNVVDIFHRVPKIPGVGEKGYVSDQEKIVVGGVTLNHLSWASALGVPTALMALHGDDETGVKIRQKMGELGVSTDYVKIDSRHSTSVSIIFLQTDGERSIIMAPRSTSAIDGNFVNENFGTAISTRASMLTTEISQVPLSGVEALLQGAAKAGIVSMLDVDVPPSVAVAEAKLGDLKTLARVIKLAKIVKPTLESARELFPLFGAPAPSPQASLDSIASDLRALLNCQLVAITNSSSGAALATATDRVIVPCHKVAAVKDTTGAGDAFFGGMIAAIYYKGLPKSKADLQFVGGLGAAAGASCVQVLGALPDEEGVKLLRNYLPDYQHFPSTKSRSAPAPRSSTPTSSSSSQSVPKSFSELVEHDIRTLEWLHKKSESQGAQKRFEKFVEHINEKDNLYITGIGKSGLVGRRMAASLSSIGVAAEYVQASEFYHGDLGKLKRGDSVVFISHSGRTPELLSLVPHLKERGVTICSILGIERSELEVCSDYVLHAPIPEGSEALGLVPTASVVAQESAINSIIRSILISRGTTANHFKRNHPGGAIGGKK